MSINAEDYGFVMGLVGALAQDIASNTRPGASGSACVPRYLSTTTAWAAGVLARLNRCKDHKDEMQHDGRIGYHRDMV